MRGIMGYRAHVVKAGSKDEHTDGEYFNRVEQELLDLFDSHGIRYGYDFVKRPRVRGERIVQWSIKDVELKTLIALLEESPDEVDECFAECHRSYSNQEAADIFKLWLKEADVETGLIYVHWY